MRASAAKGYCSRSGRSVRRSVGRSLCTHVFSRTVAAVDTKRRYVGMCNGRSAQQESGTSKSKNSVFTGEVKIYTDVYISRESGEWWISNVGIWVGTRSAWHNKSLERRCQTAVRMFPGSYYTRCALIRTDGRLYTMSCNSD